MGQFHLHGEPTSVSEAKRNGVRILRTCPRGARSPWREQRYLPKAKFPLRVRREGGLWDDFIFTANPSPRAKRCAEWGSDSAKTHGVEPCVSVFYGGFREKTGVSRLRENRDSSVAGTAFSPRASAFSRGERGNRRAVAVADFETQGVEDALDILLAVFDLLRKAASVFDEGLLAVARVGLCDEEAP